MPPPRRAKTEISEPPKASPTRSWIAGRRRVVERRGEEPVVAGDAAEGEADDEQAGDRARPERDLERRRDPSRAASAVRTFERTDTFMPMKPAAADSSAPIRNPNAVPQPSLS